MLAEYETFLYAHNVLLVVRVTVSESLKYSSFDKTLFI